MKLIVLLCLLVLAETAWGQNADRWAQVSRETNRSTWLDTTTIGKQGTTRYAWTELRLFAPEESGGKKYDKTSYRAQYNCETGETVIVQAILYTGDSIVGSSPLENLRFTAPPGSAAEVTFEYVCGKRSFPLRGVAGDP